MRLWGCVTGCIRVNPLFAALVALVSRHQQQVDWFQALEPLARFEKLAIGAISRECGKEPVVGIPLRKPPVGWFVRGHSMSHSLSTSK